MEVLNLRPQIPFCGGTRPSTVRLVFIFKITISLRSGFNGIFSQVWGQTPAYLIRIMRNVSSSWVINAWCVVDIGVSWTAGDINNELG